MSLTKFARIKPMFMSMALVLVGFGSMMTPRPAQAFVCFWCATEITQYLNYGQLTTQYAKQLDQLRQQVQQYEQQVRQYQQMSLGDLKFQGNKGYRVNIAAEFPERGIDEGKVESCGTKAKNNPVGQQQYGYCVAIVQTQNRRYNAMVKMLKDVEMRDQQLEKAYANRGNLSSDTDQGKLQVNTNYIEQIQAQMANDLQNGQYTIDAYTALLTSLNENMVRSANTALKNKNSPSIIDTAIQGAALKIALQGARIRER